MLVHYIFVRRDLPIGVMCAHVTHAAGESAAMYEADAMNGYVESPFFGATAVVLEARNEDHLCEIRDYLHELNIRHVEVVEGGGDYHDQFMAIGVVPAERTDIGDYMRPFQCLRTCLDKPREATVNSIPYENTRIQEGSPGLVSQSGLERD